MNGCIVATLRRRATTLVTFLVVMAIELSASGDQNTEESDKNQRPPMFDSSPAISKSILYACIESSHQAVVPVRDCQGTSDELVLSVVFDERSYVLGEPILVRCLLINATKDAVAIPYSYRGDQKNAKMLFRIRSPDGVQIRPLALTVCALGAAGPEPQTIPPGKQFVHTVNLAYDYAIVRSGQYDVSVEYESDGKYFEWDREALRAVAKPAWAGTLEQRVGRLVVDGPATDDDKAAHELFLNLYAECVGADPTHRQRYARMALMMFGDWGGLSDTLIARHPKSRYADFARLHSAAFHLDRLRDTSALKFAQTALERLEAIDLDAQSLLVREWVLYHMIQARSGLGHPARELEVAIDQFRANFPDSPYPLQDSAD